MDDSFSKAKDIRRIDSVSRTADQTQIVHFWADSGGTFTLPSHWNVIAQTISGDTGATLDYDTLNIHLTAVPEPATCLLTIAGTIAWALTRNNRVI
jgi:hypothetical protein